MNHQSRLSSAAYLDVAALDSVIGGFNVDVPALPGGLPEYWVEKDVQLDTNPTYEPGTVTPEPPVVVIPEPTNEWGSSSSDGSAVGEPEPTTPATGAYESADGTSGGSDPVGGQLPDGGWCDTPSFPEDPPVVPNDGAPDPAIGTPVSFGDPVSSGGVDPGTNDYGTGGVDGSYSYDNGASYTYDYGASYTYDSGSSYSYDSYDSYDGGSSYWYDSGSSYDAGGGYSYDSGGGYGFGGWGGDWY